MGTRLKLPAGVLAASFGDVDYQADGHGCIDVDAPEAVQTFIQPPFGFTVATIDDEDDEPTSFESMTKVELVQWLVDRGVEVPAGKIRKPALLELIAEYQEAVSGKDEE